MTYDDVITMLEETETQIEDILIAHDLPYEKSEVWIESEKLYEVLYQTQIIGG